MAFGGTIAPLGRYVLSQQRAAKRQQELNERLSRETGRRVGGIESRVVARVKRR